MPDIPVSAKNLKRLEAIVRSFETIDGVVVRPFKTIDDVVELLLDRHKKLSRIPASVGKGLHFVPEDIPPLATTKLRYAEIDGKELLTPNWQSLAGEMLDIAYYRLKGFDALRRVTEAKIVKGSRPRYNTLRRAPIAFQAVNADKSFQITASLARTINVGFMIHFQWPITVSALHPGKIGACACLPDED